jgi:hypothetical protein
MVFAEALIEYLIDGLSEALAKADEQVLTFRSTSAIAVYETLREALAGDPGDA